MRSDHWPSVSSVTQRRGATYSGEAAGKSGKLRCHIVCRRLPDDSRAQYSMLLCNESDVAAQVTAFVPDAPQTPYRTVVETTIGPYSDLSTTVALELEPGGAIPEIHLALTNGDIQLLFSVSNHSPETIPFALPRVGPSAPAAAPSAPPPDIIEQRAPARMALNLTLFVLVLVALLAIDGAFACRPQVAGLTAQPNLPAGTGLSVAYQTLGVGTADYAVLSPEGQTLAAGPLRAGSGRFDVSLPRTATSQTYLVRARISNLLGSAFRDTYVRVAAPVAVAPPPHIEPAHAPAAPPVIRSFAVDRSTLASGETLDVSYRILAAHGTLALVDPAAQITYARERLGAAGHASFIAPRTDTTRLLSVVISAERGSATAQSRIDVTVTPPNSSKAPTSTPPPRDATIDPGFAPPTISVPALVHSQQAIPVDVRGASPGLQLVLLGGDGTEVGRRDVQAGDSTIEFSAPQVRVATHLILEALYPNNNQTRPIVRTIIVKP